MNGLRHLLRRFGGTVPILGAALLVGALALTAAHVHPGAASDAGCAVCSSAHAPADVACPTVAAPTPLRLASRIVESPAETAPAGRVVAVPARGPPLS